MIYVLFQLEESQLSQHQRKQVSLSLIAAIVLCVSVELAVYMTCIRHSVCILCHVHMTCCM